MQQLGDSFPLTANIITADAPSVSAKMLSSYSLPIDGWKPIMNNLEEGRSFERVNPGLETITLSADTQTDPAVFADYTTDVDMTNFSIGYHLDGVAARFITEIARQVLPNIYVPTETGQQLELACAEITTRNKQGQELKNRVAIRSTKTFSMTIMYADETMLWDQTVWDKLMGTLVIPGSFEQSDHESNAPLLVDSSVQQPAVTSMTDTSPVAVEQFQGLAVTESPHLQPVASPILPITPPSSNKSPIIIAIIAVFVLVALVVGGIIIFRSVLWPSTISDEAISRLGQDRLGVVESGKSVAIGETVQTQTYEFKVDKIARNWQGETIKLYPGDSGEYVHIYLTISNPTSKIVSVSEIDFTALVDDKMTLFDYNPEPDSLGKEDEYTLQSGQAISKTVTLKVPTGSLSAKLVQEALATDGKQSQIYSIVLY